MNSRITPADFPVFRLSTTAKYAVQGMIGIAQQNRRDFVLAEEIAQKRNLPKNFLSKIFQKLARCGLLISHRGPGGGYELAREPNQISLAEIIEAVEEKVSRKKCVLELRNCMQESPCPIHRSVMQADKILRETLNKVTLLETVLSERRKG